MLKKNLFVYISYFYPDGNVIKICIMHTQLHQRKSIIAFINLKFLIFKAFRSF